MKIGQVTGTVVSTIHLPIMTGKRMLLVDLLDLSGQATGDYVIAVDTVDAGAGETVLILDEGTGARQVLGEPDAPIRAVVVGIVDEVSVGAGAES
jgi:microcompartment protein CcmK/EutM